MSQFKTTIPVDLSSVRKLLPNGSDVEGIHWNNTTREVEMTWSNRKLKTPYNVPTDFPVQMLHDQQLPKSVQILEAQQKQAPLDTSIVTVNEKAVDLKPKRGVKKCL